jgi:hypothetical protein
MAEYILTEDEIKLLEDNPALLAARLKVWRSAIEDRNAQAAKTREFIRQQSDRAGEV